MDFVYFEILKILGHKIINILVYSTHGHVYTMSFAIAQLISVGNYANFSQITLYLQRCVIGPIK